MTSTGTVLRSVRAVALGAAAFAAFPGYAAAADAPLRTIGITPTGAATGEAVPVGVSPDGREVIQRNLSRVFVRDVAAGTTTELVQGVDEVGASNDTKLVAVLTNAKLVAADTDADEDVYLINRGAGNAATLVTGPALNLEIAGNQRNAFVDGLLISGNGNVIRYGVSRAILRSNGETTWDYEQWRYDRSTGVNTRTSTGLASIVRRLDDAGKVEVTATQIKVDGRTWPIPAAAGTRPYTWIAQDGGSVVFRDYLTPKLYVVNTSTGVSRTVNVPSWIPQGTMDVFAPWNGGGDFVLIGTRVNRSVGVRYALGRLQVSNGALTQYGPDIPITESSQLGAISSNLAFAGTNVHLAQLGTTPLPGTEAAPPSGAKAFDYIEFVDATCNQQPFGGVAYTRPSVYMRRGAQGNDLRTPTRSEIKVTMNSGTVANQFALAPGASRELTSGRLGGFTIAAKVTFTDGTSVQGTNVVPSHPSPYCNPFYWF
ncbi:MAG: hypothetical protein JHD16_14135 [Solirubrobacteraceae bacterium]|nr:hypothetical protein [Solirubrobacteraceae bacterium]